MKRRGFFGGLVVLAAAPLAVLAQRQKTEKHWVCVPCGKPLGDPHKMELGMLEGKLTPIYGDTKYSCPECGSLVACTVWR